MLAMNQSFSPMEISLTTIDLSPLSHNFGRVDLKSFSEAVVYDTGIHHTDELCSFKVSFININLS